MLYEVITSGGDPQKHRGCAVGGVGRSVDGMIGDPHMNQVLEAFGGAVPGRLWICPPTRMDEHELTEEGYYSIFGRAGARTEMPGCSLCMGNQARVRDGATVMSTSTRNFPNRMGKDARVYLGSAELSAVRITSYNVCYTKLLRLEEKK